MELATFKTTVTLILVLFVAHITEAAIKNCLKPSTESAVPNCKIVDNIQQNPSATGTSSYECLDEWENTIYVLKDGDITLDCTHNEPIDMDYDGVLPIANLNIDYYKKFEPTTSSTGLDSVELSYGVRIRILTHRLAWSGRYVFYPAGDRNNSVTISVFVERKFLPFFLPLKHTADLDAYVDPTGKTLVIPCRVVNYASNVTLYFDYGPSDLSSDVVKYDPRIGFLITIDESEGVAYGLYECLTQWNEFEDRVKVQATAPDEVTEAPEVGNVTKRTVAGAITYETLGNNEIKGKCSRPIWQFTDFEGFIFVNLKARNPTHSRLGWNCFEGIHACEDGKQSGIPITGTQTLEIESLYYAGLLTCSDSAHLEAHEYFVGTDYQVYYDWNVAVANQVLVKVTPMETYERYTIHGEYEFNCQFSSYIGVKPIWWGIKFQNGTLYEEFDVKEFFKSFKLELDMVQIQCGITLWNSTTWYKASLPITVTDFALPVIKDKNTVIRFDNEAINQALVCETEAQPAVTIQWMKDGQKIQDIPSMQFQNNSMILFFEAVQQSHEGKYTCVATSPSGDTQLDFFVSVGPKPDFGGALLPSAEEPANAEGENLSPGSSNDLIVIAPIGNLTPIASPSPTPPTPTMTLRHMRDDKEVDSTNSVVPGEILVLRIPTQDCEINGGIVSENECKFFVRVISTDANGTSNPYNIDPNAEETHGRIRFPGPAPGTSGVNPNFNEDDGSGPLYPEVFDTKPMMVQLLAPLVVGFGSILLVIIIAYVTYTYYVMPWKVRRISQVPTVYKF